MTHRQKESDACFDHHSWRAGIYGGTCEYVMQLYLLSARCKDGYFGLSADDALGCTRCFCYGHSSNCTASGDYVLDVIQSDFTTGACCASFVTTVHDSYVINNIVTTMI